MQPNLKVSLQKILSDESLSAKAKLAEISALINNQNETLIPKAQKAADILRKLERNPEKIPQKIKIGFEAFEKEFGPLNEGEVWIFGGRPGMGVTQLLIHLSCNMLALGHSVLYVDFSKNPAYLLNKFLATKTGIPFTDIFEKKLTETEIDKLKNASNSLKKQNLYLGNNDFEYDGFINYCETQIFENKIKVLVLDSIHSFFKSLGKARVEAISQKLILLAEKYKIAILIGQNLSRAIEKRGGDYRPIFDDFRANHYFERLATKFMSLYRPAYYGIACDEEGRDMADILELRLVKSNNSYLNDLQLKINFKNSTITEIIGELPFLEWGNSTNLSHQELKGIDFLKIQLENLKMNGMHADHLESKTGLQPPLKPKNDDHIYIAVKYYLQTMDTEMLDCLLDRPEYQNFPKKVFLNNLETVFNKFREQKDTFFYSVKSSCQNCNKGQEGFAFVGNNTGNYINLLFYIENDKIIDLHECGDLKLGYLGVNLNSFVYIDDSMTSSFDDFPF